MFPTLSYQSIVCVSFDLAFFLNRVIWAVLLRSSLSFSVFLHSFNLLLRLPSFSIFDCGFLSSLDKIILPVYIHLECGYKDCFLGRMSLQSPAFFYPFLSYFRCFSFSQNPSKSVFVAINK